MKKKTIKLFILLIITSLLLLLVAPGCKEHIMDERTIDRTMIVRKVGQSSLMSGRTIVKFNISTNNGILDKFVLFSNYYKFKVGDTIYFTNVKPLN